VLPLGDAIPDGAGTARHLEVLAEGFGQLLTARLRQIEDAAVNLADLLRGEGSEAWISSQQRPDRRRASDWRGPEQVPHRLRRESRPKGFNRSLSTLTGHLQ
jgi:hypothetical protein